MGLIFKGLGEQEYLACTYAYAYVRRQYLDLLCSLKTFAPLSKESAKKLAPKTETVQIALRLAFGFLYSNVIFLTGFLSPS